MLLPRPLELRRSPLPALERLLAGGRVFGLLPAIGQADAQGLGAAGDRLQDGGCALAPGLAADQVRDGVIGARLFVQEQLIELISQLILQLRLVQFRQLVPLIPKFVYHEQLQAFFG